MHSKANQALPVRHRLARLVILLALPVLGACSSVPDAVNPVEWYKGTVDWFGDESDPAEETESETAKKPTPGEGKSFPNLATVPAAPVRGSAEERRRVEQGLIADRENARYADEEARSDQPVEATAPVSAQQALERATPPAPDAAPRTPVTRAPLAPSSPSPDTRSTLAAAPPATGQAVSDVYRQRLEQSAPTVTTAPVGPTSPSTTIIATAPEPVTAAAPEAAPAAAQKRMKPLTDFDATGTAISYLATVIYYNRGSASLSQQDINALRQVAEQYKSNGGMVRIIGHASSQTKDMNLVSHRLTNFKLSMDRANGVAEKLASLGVGASDLYVGAKSDSQPVYFEVMPAGEAGNRRTEIYIDY